MQRTLAPALAAFCLVALSACNARPIEVPLPRIVAIKTLKFPQTLETKVDLLFVIDNSGSMGQEQANLAKQFPKLVDALRRPDLGDRIPNVRIGVVSTDLGAGNYGLPSCEVQGGDGGKLQNTPRKPGCAGPADAWISYSFETDKTNIPGCSGDGVDCVKSSFSCIAQLGTEGCGFESPLEAARKALDPNVNPGFLRKDALLAVVFITDEDDCSARNAQLFDPQQQGSNDPLGPLTSFRCFEFGVLCDVNDRNAAGPRQNCVPAFDWLHKVDDYVSFFSQLKGSKDRVLLAAIAGPTSPVTVGKDGPNPTLAPSCQTNDGFAVPALRLAKVVNAFGGEIAPICTDDFGPALSKIGERIRSALGSQCISKPLLTRKNELACAAGTAIGGGKSCDATNLADADCAVEELLGGDDRRRVEIPRCSDELFDPKATSCGDQCPCWRIVARPADRCGPTATPVSTPFGLDILHATEPEKGTIAVGRCRVLTVPWGSAKMLEYLDAQ